MYAKLSRPGALTASVLAAGLILASGCSEDNPVDPANTAPSADAGADRSARDCNGDGMENISLDGSGSVDADGSIVTWEWSVPGLTIDGVASPTVAFPIGIHTVTLTVTDDRGAVATDVITVEVVEFDPGFVPTYQIIEAFAGTGVNGLSQDGLPPLSTDFSLPQDMTWGPDCQPYILDWNNHRVRTIRNDRIETVVGTGELGNADDGPALAARLNHPTHVSFDLQGRLIMSAWHNSKIQRVDLTTGMLETIVGNGNRTFSGDGGPANLAEVDLPLATAFTETGEMYLTDQASQRIRVVDASGIITTAVGTGVPGYSGDNGPANQAQVSFQTGQAASPLGKIAYRFGMLYIADTMNSCVRRVDLSTGIITTFAGTGANGFSGDGGPATAAQISFPADVDVDSQGNVYIADTFNNCIRKVDTSGIITTLVGVPGSQGDAGDGGHPLAAVLDRPNGICFDAADRLYVIDTWNNRIRVVY